MIIKRAKAFPVTQEMIDAGLKGNELIVYAYLEYLCYNVQGWYMDGLAQLARDLKLSEPTVIHIIQKFVENGIVEKDYYLDENKIRRCKLRTV